MATDDYILVTGSRNLDDNKDDDVELSGEKDDSSRSALEKQGIFVEQDSTGEVADEQPNDYSHDIQEIEGIEILARDESDNDY